MSVSTDRARAAETNHRRSIRSFVRREGRLTRSQSRALERLQSRYGVEIGGDRLDLGALFGPGIPVVLDIGFGSGEALVELAGHNLQRGYLGVEVYRPGIGRLLRRLEAEGIANVRVVCADAMEIMKCHLSEGVLTGIQVFFPDPWPKRRHHKRRLIQPEWVELAASRLASGGFLHLATDWQDYAEHMLAVIEASARFANCAGGGRFAAGAGGRPPTRYEQRGRSLGHGVWDLVFLRR